MPVLLAVVAVAGVALDLGHDLGVGSMDVRDRAFDAGELLVVAPALVGVGLGERRELARLVPGASAARTAKRVSVATKSAIGIDGVVRVELERLAALDLATGGSGTAASSRS